MESSQSIKIITTKDKIFNVRKLPYKQFDNQKYLKENYSPLHVAKENTPREGSLFKSSIGHQKNSSNMEYHYQLTLTSSSVYKDLQVKYREMREEQKREKEDRLKVLREREEELHKYVIEQRRLEREQERLFEKKEELCEYIERLREKREQIQQHQMRKVYSYQEQQGQQQFQVVNADYIQDMMMSMQYQGGIDINPDNMTYEELLQLQQKMGKVSKGINEEQYKLLPKYNVKKEEEEELCSICYYNLKEDQVVHKLPCKHVFHCECIKEWLMKEKVCPMCKQEIKLVVPGEGLASEVKLE